MSQPASAVCDWTTVLRAAEHLLFRRTCMWNHGPLWYVEFDHDGPGSLSRDIVIDGDEVRTVSDCDV
jgi:hypothetical protein